MCLGDGHDGIWNLFAQLDSQVQRLEILDWYHLIENLGNVGGSHQRLDAVEACLCQGDVEGAIKQFDDWPHERVDRFIAYLAKHRRRIVNYAYYLRRAAIEFVKGQTSSYLTRYRDWQAGIRNRRDAKPPVFNVDAGCYPALYKGQLVKFDNDLLVACIKVWNGSDWVWAEVPIASKRKRHLTGAIKSPYLVISEKHCHLAVPFSIIPPTWKSDVVCAVDVGINTLATASIVCPDGTLLARKFIHPASDIDRRDKQANIIRQKARKTKTLHRGFAKTPYRKAKGINANIAQQVSRQIINLPWSMEPARLSLKI